MSRRASYILGFVLSLVLTLAAFDLVNAHLLSGTTLIVTILVLALIQFSIQLIFFLHLLDEPSPHWNLTVFVSGILTIIIVIGASIWIMHNLHYRHTSVEDQTNYILKSEGIQ